MNWDGTKLKQIREGKGESIAELSKVVRRTKGAIYNWEGDSQTPTVSTLCILCEHYGVKPNYFFV